MENNEYNSDFVQVQEPSQNNDDGFDMGLNIPSMKLDMGMDVGL